jgi:Tfp pilus assembly protein PilP
MRFAKRSRWLMAALAVVVMVAPDAFGQARAAAKVPPKAAKKPVITSEEAARPSVAGRRDPFAPLVVRQRGAQAEPPECKETGKRGLVISTLRVDGIVRSQGGMIAVVSNPQQRVYFFREGEEVCNGRVERISFEGITFSETGRDAFGKPFQRTVSKPLYPSAGVQR